MSEHPYAHMIPWSHLNEIRKAMDVRRADRLWLGTKGGKGESALPNYQLGNQKKVWAMNAKNHAPDKNIVFNQDNLWPREPDGPLSMADLDALMSKALARINRRKG